VTDCHALPVGDLMPRSFNTLAMRRDERLRIQSEEQFVAAANQLALAKGSNLRTKREPAASHLIVRTKAT
jgi:hypothetical protein